MEGSKNQTIMEGGELLTQLTTASALERREYGSGDFNESMGKDKCDDTICPESDYTLST